MTILYINGDSHSAAAEAVNLHAFAEDDGQFAHLGRAPHPDNLEVSYGNQLAKSLNATLYCDAESASSNCRIVRTTLDYLNKNKPDLVVIGWTTWEREEWLHNGTYWQINAGPPGDDWPRALRERYKQWVLNIDWSQKEQHWHNTIYELHGYLNTHDIKHLFFNCYEPFTVEKRAAWGNSYIGPYNFNDTYYNWLIAHGFKTIRPDSYHFGPCAHREWAAFLYRYLMNYREQGIIL